MLRSTCFFQAPKPSAASSARKAFNTRLSRQKFASPTSLRVFQRPIQEQLRDHLSKRTDLVASQQYKMLQAAKAGVTGTSANFTKRNQHHQNVDSFQYWLSFPQALRQFNTMPRFGQVPATVTNGASKIIPITALKESEEQWLLSAHPPFFNSGVGIFYDWKWHRVQAPAMAKHLNPDRKPRVLFIDMDTCEDNGFSVRAGVEPLELKGICDRLYFCADQMEHPHKVFPTRGLALNPTTARRFSQPAHDVLVTASLLRGYISPYWLTENQITRFYRIGIDRKCMSDFVEVPGRFAILVKLSSLHKDMRSEILKKFPAPDEQEREGLSVALDGCNWEVVLHQQVLTHMTAKCKTTQEMELWVSVSMLRYMFQNWNKGTPSWAFLNCRTKDEVSELTDFLNHQVGKDNWIDQASVTKLKLFNAEATTNPKMVLPQTKNLALCGGRPLHHRILPTVMKHAFERGYLSPVWLSPLDITRIPSLAVKPGEKPLEICEQNQVRELLYNIDDLEDFSSSKFLNERPPPSDASLKPYVFLVSAWQPVLSGARSKVLQNSGRKKQLWLTHNEIVFNGLIVKNGVEATEVTGGIGGGGKITSRTKNRGKGENVRRLFNAAQTTDPVRVSALALMKN